MEATGGHNADSPNLISPLGAIAGVQFLPFRYNVIEIPFKWKPCLASNLTLVHFGPIVFQFFSE